MRKTIALLLVTVVCCLCFVPMADINDSSLVSAAPINEKIIIIDAGHAELPNTTD